MSGGKAAGISSSSSDAKVIGQYRVFVTEALIAGQPVRASTGSAEYLVRVPEQAQTGDSFVFKVTEEDVELSSHNDIHDSDTTTTTTTSLQQQQQQHIIEAAVLDKKKTWHDRVRDTCRQFRHELETQVLCDARRVVLLSAALAVSLCTGFMVGSLLVTSDLYCSQCSSSTTTTASASAAAARDLLMARQA